MTLWLTKQQIHSKTHLAADVGSWALGAGTVQRSHVSEAQQLCLGRTWVTHTLGLATFLSDTPHRVDITHTSFPYHLLPLTLKKILNHSKSHPEIKEDPIKT